jgi:hypothetical protein
MEQIADSPSSPVSSGVMMTHKPDWSSGQEGRITHITASWGFGGGGVSATISADEWVLTDEQRYESVRRKPTRLSVLPEGIQSSLKQIGGLLNTIVTQIDARKHAIIPFEQTAKNISALALSIFRAIENSAEKHHPFHLSLHASMLRHLLGQFESQHVSTFTIAGIEKASEIPLSLSTFIDENQQSSLLCELALFGRKAFSEDVIKMAQFGVQATKTPLVKPGLLENLRYLLHTVQKMRQFCYFFLPKKRKQ